MSDVFDTWRRLSFGGIEFPYTDIQIKGALRHHLHEYIKRPGGEVETLARRAYQITVRCEMLDLVLPVRSFKRYVDLYPSQLSALISLCEQGLPQDLFLPPLGRALRCKAIDWTRSISAARRSGESVEFQFLEDSSDQFTTLNLIGAKSASLTPKLAALQVEVEALGDPDASSAFDRLLDAVNSYIDARDRVTDAAEYQTARIDAAVGRCQELSRVDVINTAAGSAANTALVRTWSIILQERNAQFSSSRPLLGYRTPRAGMSVVDVSVELFDTPANAVEILRLNDLDDAMSIPRDTPIRYLAAA